MKKKKKKMDILPNQNRIKTKMRFLQIIKKEFARLGLSPDQSRVNGKSAMIFFVFSLSITLSNVFLFLKANTFMEYVINIYAMTAMLGCNISFTFMIIKKEKFFETIDNVQKFVDEKSKNPALKVILDETNRQVDKWCEIAYFVSVKVTPICLIIPRAIISYAIYFTTNAGSEAFELPSFFWFPFNWRNPIGYFLVCIFLYVLTIHSLIYIFCMVFFGIGCCVFEISVIKYIENDLNLINENGKIGKNQTLALKGLSDFIECHSTLKKFVMDFMNIYQIQFIILFVWALITTCCAFLLIQMLSQERDSVAILIISIYVSYAYGLVFGVCESGQRLTNAFDEIDIQIEAFDWYLYPHELRRMLPLILMEVQRPIVQNCFGSISVLRETYKKIIKGAFSYFMTMRKFIE